MTRNKKIGLGLVALCLLTLLAVGGWGYRQVFSPQFHPAQAVSIYLDRDDNVDSLYHKVRTLGQAHSLQGFRWLHRYRGEKFRLRTGHYRIEPGESAYVVFNRFYRGQQTPINLAVGQARTMERLARQLSKQLMIDSAEIVRQCYDERFMAEAGQTRETLPSLIIPDTYQVYWDISAADLGARLLKEYRRYWNDDRRQQAEQMGLSIAQVATLASIVDEETNDAAEKPAVAGLYLNRLRIGMPLQADPTVKFALQAFGIRRILKEHLRFDSPYNTYIYTGLPPGPIRIASKVAIESVLRPAQHPYLYMVAKEDFSGTHRFAESYTEHLANARRYQQALNERKIFR